MIRKIDLKKELKHLYAPSPRKIDVVKVPKFSFAMIDGEIEPGQTPSTSPAFGAALMALYGVSYTLKFMCKLREKNPVDYPVMALEGLWWVEGEAFDFSKKQPWKWTAMILQPKPVTPAMFRAAVQRVAEKRDSPALARLRLASFQEGLCIQTLHVGPYSDEPRTLERMHTFAAANGLRFRGKHHEIYLGDPRRAKPERLRTILRHPVEKAERTR